MPPRQPSPPTPLRADRRRIPLCWLMIDARLGEGLPRAIAAMPPRSAVVVRPYALATKGRAATIRAIRRAARAKRHLLLLAGDGSLSGYDGRHFGGGARLRAAGGGFLSVPVHDRAEALRARRLAADAVLVSPVWPTRSHPGAAVLGVRGFAGLARLSGCYAIALGGMTATRFIALRRHGAHGFAAIDAWARPRAQG